MKIVHLSVGRDLSGGIAKQLYFENLGAKDLESAIWHTISAHEGKLVYPFERRIPFPFRALFLRNLYSWILALRLSRDYDIVMMRHIAFDPFVFFFASLIRNRVSIHHAKEIQELPLIRGGWKGKAASAFERISGGFAVRRAKMILGVTQEIADYECRVHKSSRPIGLYPNGIDASAVPVLCDGRSQNEIHTAFICSVFSPWHGLDKLIDAVDANIDGEDELPLTIHLIGRLKNEQIAQLNATPARRRTFRQHGVMVEAEYRTILRQCDCGIASLAMERKNLTEGSTLKVREMLAMGLPVYSGHHDPALRPDKPFVKITDCVNLKEMMDFAISVKKLSRADTRKLALPYIEKKEAMRRVVQYFSDMK